MIAPSPAPSAAPAPGTIADVARFLSAGDAGLVVEFGEVIDRKLSARVTEAARAIGAARIPGVTELTPTYRSILVRYDPLATSQAAVRAAVGALAVPRQGEEKPPRIWRIPVLYGGAFGPDLEAVAHARGLPPDEVVRRHADIVYHVYMLGFVPGFAYLGDVDPAIRVARHRTPRVRVPAGTVAIALEMTAVYPRETPGGWQLLGHTPARLFDLAAARPSLLMPGEGVRFVPVDAGEHRRLSAAVERGEAVAESEAGDAQPSGNSSDASP